MLERWLAGVHSRLRQLSPGPTGIPADGTTADGTTSVIKSTKRQRAYSRTHAEAVATAASRAQRMLVYDEVRRRRAVGEPLLAISRTMGIARATARKYAYVESFPERSQRVPAPASSTRISCTWKCASRLELSLDARMHPSYGVRFVQWASVAHRVKY